MTEAERPAARLVADLVAAQTALALDEDTAYPRWDGRAPDYAACVDAVASPRRSVACRGAAAA